jgi:ribonuclease P protein component
MPAPNAARVWIGLVVPKRHAKRSVTRTLMKRQIRMAFEVAGERLRPGMWVVRLKAPFGKSDYPSAASAALRSVVREELTALVAQGVRQRDRTS